VISNLRIDSTLVNEYLPFAHFFSFFFICMLYLLHSLVKYICMFIYFHVLIYQDDKDREVDCHDLAKVSKHVTWHACQCNTSMTIIECSSLELDMSTFSIKMTEQKREHLSNLTRMSRFTVKAWLRLIRVWTTSCTTISICRKI